MKATDKSTADPRDPQPGEDAYFEFVKNKEARAKGRWHRFQLVPVLAILLLSTGCSLASGARDARVVRRTAVDAVPTNARATRTLVEEYLECLRADLFSTRNVTPTQKDASAAVLACTASHFEGLTLVPFEEAVTKVLTGEPVQPSEVKMPTEAEMRELRGMVLELIHKELSQIGARTTQLGGGQS